MEKQTRWGCILLFAVAAAAAALLLALQRATTFTADDYYYALFWQGGPLQFLRHTAGHFFSRNGRVLVHVLVSAFAALDLTVYGVCHTAILAGVFALLFRWQRDGAPTPAAVWAVGSAGYFLLLLGTDYRVMKSWFLCVADAFNYVFPLLMLGLTLLLLDRREEAGKRPAVLALCALLAGATTEQGGTMAAGLLLLELLRRRLTEKRWDRRTLWALCAAVLGLLTIFLSPATRQRAAAEFSLGGLWTSFVQYANSLAAPGLSLRAMVVSSAALGLLPLTGKAPRLLFAGLPVGALLAAGWFLPLSVERNSALCALFFVYLLLAAGLLIFRSPYCRSGFLLLAGLASAGLVMLSRSCTVRVTTPLVLILHLCTVHALGALYARFDRDGGKLSLPAAAVSLAALIGVAVWQIPTFTGVWGNYAILRENGRAAEAARTTGVLVYEDYDPNYCVEKVFSSDLIAQLWLQFYELPPETEVARTYTPGPTAALNGGEEETVVHDGRTFLPLRAVVEGNGGTIEVITDNFLRIRTAEGTLLYHAPGFYTGTEVVDASRDVLLYNSRFHISEELAQTLGLL